MLIRRRNHMLTLLCGQEASYQPSPRYVVMIDSSGVYICESIVNFLKHGNYICKSEGIYLTYEYHIEIPVEFTYKNQ